MPNIKPISDLRNYNVVLQDVADGSPVYLTKNGRGAYCITSIEDQEEAERAKAALKLMCELNKGSRSGEVQGWVSFDEVKNSFRRKVNG